MTAHTRILLALCLPALALLMPGCGNDNDDDGSGAWIEIGTGIESYEPLTAGQQMPITQGPQGGFHVWGGFAGDGFDPSNAEISYVLVVDDQVVATATIFDTIPRVGDQYEYSRVTVILRGDVFPEDISGQTATLAVRVRTDDDQELTDQIEVVPTCCEYISDGTGDLPGGADAGVDAGGDAGTDADVGP